MATAVATQARRDLAAITEEAERAIDRLHAPQAPRIAQAVRNRAESGKITWDARRAILRDVDAILDAIYGHARGAPSPLGAIVTGHAEVAYGVPTVREVQRLAPILADQPALVRAVEAA
jgi:hypothetical protein